MTKGVIPKKYWLRENREDESDLKRICEHLSVLLRTAKVFGKAYIAQGQIAYINPKRDCQIDNSKIIYMNQVRHPVHAFISNYYYSKHMLEVKNPIKMAHAFFCFENIKLFLSQAYNRTDEFFESFKNLTRCAFSPISAIHNYIRFCGYDDVCRDPNNSPEQMALQAKENVERHYILVGILEELDMSLRIYELILPQYFGGLSFMYNADPDNKFDFDSLTEEPTSPEVWKVLSQCLEIDIQFYEYLKQRLYHQARALKMNYN